MNNEKVSKAVERNTAAVLKRLEKIEKDIEFVRDTVRDTEHKLRYEK